MNDIHNIADRERELAAERDRYQEAADKMAAAHKVERDALAAENERLKAELGDLPETQAEMLTTIKRLKEQHEQIRLANVDCVMYFDAIRADYEKLKEAARMGLDWIEAQPEPRMIGALKAITALKEALGEK